MGHIRLPELPDTAPWRKVVGLIAEGASVAQIAAATSKAAQNGLNLAHDDPGLTHTLWLLTKIALAARQPNFGAALEAVGVLTPQSPSLFDIVGGMFKCLASRPNRYVSNETLKSDVWKDENTQKNTVQRAVSNLRRILRNGGIVLTFEGKKNKGHYALLLN